MGLFGQHKKDILIEGLSCRDNILLLTIISIGAHRPFMRNINKDLKKICYACLKISFSEKEY